MDPRNEEPIDRAPWRRLLGADSDAPTRDLDRRILAEARRALTPQVARWWLPASLAASVLLAVLIAQWQLADSRPPEHLTESEVLSAPPPAAADQAAPAATITTPPELLQKSETPVSRVSPPAIDLPEVERRRADEARPFTPIPAAEPAAAIPAAAPTPAPAQTRPEDAAEFAGALGNLAAMESGIESRTPEQWYADIEALRKSGRTKEADAELARFKSKYPDWLEHHQHPNP